MIPGSAAVVLASIASTSFDGAQDGAYKAAIEKVIGWFAEAGISLDRGPRPPTRSSCCSPSPASASSTCSACAGCGPSPAPPRCTKLRVGFAHTLIPIALAYLVAHYFSLFVFQEQAQFTYLLSDPLGTGHTDLFGTANNGVDYNVLSANAIWYVQVGALVIGHVIGLMLAHDRALVYWPDYRKATASQYWMLAVMVAFTCFGLYLLSVGQRLTPGKCSP